jgi:hypothetical protein
LFNNCTAKKNNEEGELIKVDFENAKLNFSEVFDSVQYIPLETNDTSLLDNINKMYLTKNRIVVADYNNKFHLFDINGRYIRQIGGLGKGPGERMTLSDFIVDEKCNTIITLDARRRKIQYFTLEGEYLYEKKISFQTSEFAKLDSVNYIFSNINEYNEDMYNIYITNSDFQIVSGYFDDIISGCYSSACRNMCAYDNSYLYASWYSNNIYKGSSVNAPKIKWKFDFGKYNIPQDLKNKFIKDKVRSQTTRRETYKHNYELCDLINNKYARYINNIKENRSFVMFYIRVKETENYYFLLNKSTKSVTVFDSNLNDDITELYFSGHIKMLTPDNKLVGVVYPFCIENENKLSVFNRIESVSSVSPFDNPVVVIYKLKTNDVEI